MLIKWRGMGWLLPVIISKIRSKMGLPGHPRLYFNVNIVLTTFIRYSHYVLVKYPTTLIQGPFRRHFDQLYNYRTPRFSSSTATWCQLNIRYEVVLTRHVTSFDKTSTQVYPKDMYFAGFIQLLFTYEHCWLLLKACHFSRSTRFLLNHSRYQDASSSISLFMSINSQRSNVTWSALFEELEVVFSSPQPESSSPWAA